MHHVCGLEFPVQCPRCRVQRVNVPVPAAEINRPFPDHRRGKIAVKRIRHGLRQRLNTVQMLARESPLPSRLELPLQCPGGGIHGIKGPIVSSEIDHLLRHCRGRRNPALGVEFPSLRSRFSIHGIKIPIRAAKINAPLDHRRRANHHAAGMNLPLQTAEVPPRPPHTRRCASGFPETSGVFGPRGQGQEGKKRKYEQACTRHFRPHRC